MPSKKCTHNLQWNHWIQVRVATLKQKLDKYPPSKNLTKWLRIKKADAIEEKEPLHIIGGSTN